MVVNALGAQLGVNIHPTTEDEDGPVLADRRQRVHLPEAALIGASLLGLLVNPEGGASVTLE